MGFLGKAHERMQSFALMGLCILANGFAQVVPCLRDISIHPEKLVYDGFQSLFTGEYEIHRTGKKKKKPVVSWRGSREN
jgi:hypothetical protein